MAVTEDSNLQALSIVLLKETVEGVDDAVRHAGGLHRVDLTTTVGLQSTLLIKRPRSHTPDWARFFEGVVDAAEFGRVSSSAAILIVTVEGRLLVLTFGQGRFLLKPDIVEERFGLKVCLNTIDETAIRSIDKRSFDALLTQSRVQTSRAAPIGEFGLDIEQDLLRAATGKPRDTSIGERISGLDNLSVSVRISLRDLAFLLPKYQQAHRSTRYRRAFPWVDQIVPVNSADEVGRLNDKLITRLSGADLSGVWLALPDVVDWNRVHGFRYGRRATLPLHYDIHISEWLDDVGRPDSLTIQFLERKRVLASDEHGEDIHDWSVFRCLYCEIEEGSATYLLSAGLWYRVKKDLVAQVNDTYQQIPRRSEALPVFSQASEGDYNVAAAEGHPQAFSCHDGRLVRVPGAGSGVEICDLYSRRGELIHVKRYAGSSVLSHHFAQAVVSAETLSLDASAREQFSAQMQPPFRFDAQRFRASDHTTVLAIVSDQPGDLAIPFFSRLNLRQACRRLTAMGFPVQLAKIEVADQTRVKKLYLAS